MTTLVDSLLSVHQQTLIEHARIKG